MLRRLWGTAPLMTTNLLETGLVDRKFNEELSRAAVAAFDEYISIHRAAVPSTATDDDNHNTTNRRRRRPRKQQQHQTNNKSDKGGGAATNNDYFFEHQRMRGYHLATSSIRSCSEAIRLQEELLPNAAAKYLQQCGNPRAQAVAERIIGAGDDHPFHVEMWSAVQRGKGAYHHDHVHEGVLVSGVYYAAVPDGSAPLILRRPVDLLVEDDDDDMILQPSEGQLVIFPPWLLHGVPLPTKESGLPRVSFAFNVNGAYAWGDPWDVTRDGNPTGV